MDMPTEIIERVGRQSSASSLDSLDLTGLPDRLDDSLLSQVRAIATAPLPPEISCDEQHLNKCLMVMIAVLPKQQTGEIGAELFVRAYHRQLCGYSNGAISFLADHATRECRWFPTIAECIEILRDWRRDDEPLHRKAAASRLVSREQGLRREEEIDQRMIHQYTPMSQEQIDLLSPELLKLGVACGALIPNDDGSYRAAPDDVVSL